MPTTSRSTSRSKVRAHRDLLRILGLRPVQIWVPDVRSKAFARAAHRQSLAVATSRMQREAKRLSMPSRHGLRPEALPHRRLELSCARHLNLTVCLASAQKLGTNSRWL
jgi:hypothetical protein